MKIQCSLWVVVVVVLTLVGGGAQATLVQWDGDNSVGNFSYNNNWYGAGNPSDNPISWGGWAYGNNLWFNYNNGGASSMYYDYGSWQNISTIAWSNTYPSSVTLNSDGNGINFDSKVENYSAGSQVINMPLSGAKNGASWIELNPVGGNLTLSNTVYNDNNKPYRVYGNNGKSLILSGSLRGNASAGLTVQENSTVQITTLQGFTGDVVAVAGTIRISASNPLPGAFVRLGGTSGESTWANLLLDGGCSLTNALNAQANNSGVLTFGNTYGVSGTATFSGSMYLDHDATLLSTNSGDTVTLSGSTLDLKNQTLTVYGPGATTISGTLQNSTGSGKLVMSGPGTLTLSAANSFAGGLTNNGGIVQITTSPYAMGRGTVVANAGATNWLNAGNVTYTNTFSGAGVLKATTANGDVTLLNNVGSMSGFTGILDLNMGGGNAGKFRIPSSQANLPSPSATIQVQSGTTLYLYAANNYGSTIKLYGDGNSENLGALRLESGANQTNSVILLGNSFIGVNSSAATISGVISDGGGGFGFTKQGNNTLTLSGANTYSGNTTNSGTGTLTLGSTNALGTGILVMSGGKLDSSVANLTNANNNAQLWNADFTFAGSQNLNLGTGAVTLGNSRQVTVTAKTLTIGGAIGGSTYGLTKLGTGTLTLSGANTYTGGTRANAGTLVLAGSQTAGSFISVNNVGAQNAVLQIASGAGTLAYTDMPVAEVNNSRGAVYQQGGTFSTSGGNGLRVGGGAPCYAYYNLSGGSLSINGAKDTAIGYGSGSVGVMDVTGGALNASSWIVLGRNGGTASGLLNVTGGSVTSGANNIGLNWSSGSGAISILNVGGGAGAATVTGVANAGNYLDVSQVNAAGTIGVVNVRPNGTLTVAQVKVTGAASTALFNFNGGTLKATTANAGVNFMNSGNMDAVTVYSGGGTIDNNSTSITIGNALRAATGNGVTSIAVTDGGSGYIGAPLVTITGGTGNPATGYAVMTDDGTGNGTFKVSSIVISSPGTYTVDPTTVTLNGGGAATAASGFTISTSANISGGMTFQGTGTTTLYPGNSYSGGTTINTNTVSFEANNTATGGHLGTGAVTVNGDGSNGKVVLGAGSVSGVNNSTVTYANSFTLNNAVLYAQDQRHVLTGNFSIGASGATLGSTYNNQGVDADKGLMLGGVVSGNGPITVQHTRINTGNNFNTSFVAFTNNANTYSGTITVNENTATTEGGVYLGVNGSTALSNATVNLGGNIPGANQKFGASPLVYNTGLGTVILGALSGSATNVLTGYNESTHVSGGDAVSLVVGNNGSSTVYSGVMTGNGSLTKVGAGTMALSATNTFTGATTISNGVLALSVPYALSNSASIAIVAGATCDVSAVSGGYTLGAAQTLMGSGLVKGDLTSLGMVSPGFSPGTLTVDGNYTNSGTLQIEIASASSYDHVVVTGNATLGGTLTVTNIADYALQSGSTYTVLTASAISGAFSTTNLPAVASGLTCTMTQTATEVIITVSGTLAASTYWWDANGVAADVGGAGIWDTTTASWRAPATNDLLTLYPNTPSSGDAAIFAGTAGAVTHSGTLNINSLVFGTDGYTLSGGTFNLSGATGAGLVVSNGVVTTISSILDGANTLTKSGNGTVVLDGNNSYSGGTTNAAGAIIIGHNSAMGSGIVTLNGGSISNAAVGSYTVGNAVNLNASSLIGVTAGDTLTLSGPMAYVGSGANAVLTNVAAGNLSISGAMTRPGSGSLALLKTGAGTLTLGNGSTWNGSGAIGYPGSGFPLVAREGTLLLNGGTHTVTGELVIGGVVANGGAGQNAQIIVDGSTLNVSSWFSLGRGNGIGAVSSDLVASNAAAISAANFSAGFNANALNMPKGSITLNNTSTLTITGNGVFHLAESAGSDMTLTLNDAAQILATGTGVKELGDLGRGTVNINGASVVNFGNAVTYVGYNTGTGTVNVAGGTFINVGELRVGGSATSGTGYNATGTVNITSGTLAIGGLLQLARANNNQNGVSGVVTVNGGVLTSTNDLIVGQGGTGLGNLTIGGGTVNVGPAATKWLFIGQYDTVHGQLDITSGLLNLMNNTCIKFSPGNTSTASSNVVNQSGGTVTFYSDNGVTAGGTGDLNLQQSGAAGVNNTYNLDGGTLIVPAVASTLTTGTRTFNFNGGTLKAAKDNASFFNLGSGSAVANVRDGGAIIDDNGKSVTIVQALLQSSIGGDAGTGGLTKLGAGTLTLSGVNTFAGGTTINNGTLTISSAGQLGGGTYAPDILDNGTLNYGSSASQILNGHITGTGALTMSGSGTLVLTAANSYSGATTVSAGTLQLNGASALSTSSALMLSGGTVSLRSDTAATFAPASITNVVSGSSISADEATTGHGGQTLTVSGNLYISGNTTLNVSSTNGDTLALGTIVVSAGSQTETLNATADSKVTVAGVQAYGVYDTLAFAGGGNIDVLGTMQQNSVNRWLALQFNQTGTATVWAANNLLGANNGNPAYAPLMNVNNGVTVFNNSSALNSVAPIRAYLGASSGTSSATVLLGGTDGAGLLGGVSLNPFLWGGIINVQDGTSGILTIGGQNTNGVNTWGASFTLGTTTDTGKSVTLLAATGGEVDFTGVIATNGADTTAGVTVGDASHAGIIKFANANTYRGPTVVSNGTLFVCRNLASSAITVVGGATLRVTNATFSGSVTLLDNAALSLTNGAANDILSVNGLTLNGGNSITFEVGSSNDSISLASGTYTAPSSGVVTINLVGRPGLSAGTYNLITGCGISDTNSFTIGSKTGTGGYVYELQASGGNLQLVVSGIPAVWWKGGIDGQWNSSSAGAFNWDTDQASGVDAETYPGNLCDVFFAANNAANYSTTLGQDFTIKSLSLLTASNVTIAGANALTLSNGITMASGAGSNTISVPTVAMAVNQIWSNASANPLVVSAAVTGNGQSLTKAGAGTLTLSGANSYNGSTTIGGGVLSVTTGGQVNSAGTAGGNYIVVGNAAGANAALNIAGGDVTLVTASGNAWASYMQVGNGSGCQGFINMTSGSLNPQRHLILGNAGGYGAQTMSAGALSVGSYFIVGFGASGKGVFNQSGGAVTQSQVSGAGSTLIGSGAGAIGVANIAGGSFNATAGGIFVAENNTSTGVLTLSGDAVVTAGNVGVRFGNNNAGSKGTLNLRGGTLTANVIQRGNGAAIFNFNGGVLAPSGASGSFMTGLTRAYVYNGGAVISNGYDITIGQALLAPSGYGVGSIQVTGNGSGYVDTPIVTITGGTGSNATAVAQVDYTSGTVTNILVTNPGGDYGSGDLLTATLSGGGGGGATLGTVLLAANTSGGLIKLGAGTLTLSGVNTYTGATIVSNGTLVVNGNLLGPVTMAAGTTLAISGSISNSLALQSGAKLILTNGTAATLAVTGGLTLDGNTMAFDIGASGDTIAMTGGAFSKSGTTTVNLTGISGVGYGAYDLITGIGISDTTGFVIGTSPAGYPVRLIASGGNLVALLPGPGTVYMFR